MVWEEDVWAIVSGVYGRRWRQGPTAAAPPLSLGKAQMQHEPIRRRKIHEEVAARLEDMIHAGDVEAGDPLPSERELMERYGVGRPAVREALLSLEKRGLVQLRSGERAKVRTPTISFFVEQLSGAAKMMLADPEGVRRFQEARTLLESTLAAHAAEVATEQDIAALTDAFARNEAARDDLETFQETDVDFHYEIARISHNPLFTGLHRALIVWLTEQRSTTLRLAGAATDALDAHRRIFEAIRARDPDAARAAMRAHLDQVTDLYWRSVSGEVS